MYDLLPQENKKGLRNDYRYRLTILIIEGLLVTGILCLIFMVPSYFLTHSKLTTVKAREAELLKNQRAAEERVVSKELEESRNNMKFVEDGLVAHGVQEVIDTVLSYKADTISIVGFNVVKAKEGEQYTVSVTGTADDRDSLVSFTKKLQKEKTFTNVVLPVSNLEKNRNIDFSMSFVANYQL